MIRRLEMVFRSAARAGVGGVTMTTMASASKTTLSYLVLLSTTVLLLLLSTSNYTVLAQDEAATTTEGADSSSSSSKGEECTVSAEEGKDERHLNNAHHHTSRQQQQQCVAESESESESESELSGSSSPEPDSILATPPWNDMIIPSFPGNNNNNNKKSSSSQQIVVCDRDPFSLRDDLNSYPTISLKDVNRSEQLYGLHGKRLVIKDNILYERKCSPDKGIVGVSVHVENMLVMLLQRVKVPDIDFVLNCSDYPQNKKKNKKKKTKKNQSKNSKHDNNNSNNNNNNNDDDDVPIISMCSSYNYHDIVVPTYTNSVFIVQGLSGIRQPDPMPWKERKEQLVWRGSDSSRIRFTFNKIANEPIYNGRTDVGINKMIRTKHDIELHGPMKDTLPGFYGYKWIATIDGSVAAYRMTSLASQGATIIKQESEYYEHWYRDLVPYKHYIPLQNDFSNLNSVIEWLETHDDEAYQIGQTMRQFANDHLTSQDILCFWYTFIYEYSSRMTYNPIVFDDMKVYQPTRSLPIHLRPYPF